MKKIILIFAAFFLIVAILPAQKIEDENYFEVQDTIYLPHYGQNIILDSIYAITMGRNSGSLLKRSDIGRIEDNIPFHIPVKIWVYHNDGGIGDNDALSVRDVYDLLEGVNNHYANSNTGIQFYLKCEIQHVSSTKYNTIDNDNEFESMVATYRDPYALNWHLIRNTNTGWSGRAVFPWKKNNFSFAVSFGGWLFDSDILTTVHEIGHTLGLLHTHENTRGTGNYNGDASNCFQESMSRTRTQGVGCVGTIGKKKCEINGDALADTGAAPNTEKDKWIEVDQYCNYIFKTTDNWGDRWFPPTRNYMSYLNRSTCRSEFTVGQIAVMHSYIFIYMIEGGSSIYPGLGTPWYNLHSISLSGTVNSGENESFIVPQKIVAANGNSTYAVKSGAKVNLFAGESITLKPGFHANLGSVFIGKTGTLTGCSNISPSTLKQKSNLELKSLSTLNDNEIEECRQILWRAFQRKALEDAQSVSGEENLPENNTDLVIFPNPNKGNFIVELSSFTDENFEIQIVNQVGVVVLKEYIHNKAEVTIPNAVPGIYFVLVNAGDKVFTQKMIVQ